VVRGLDKFREQFRAYADQYVLIGGAACDLLMEEAGLEFRATKARAWLDLTGRKGAGEAVDAKSIAKHKNDVFRLYRVVDPAFKTAIPKKIIEDMGFFLDAMRSEPVDLKNLGINGQSLESILGELRRLYAHK
jgi:hypothetical protein